MSASASGRTKATPTGATGARGEAAALLTVQIGKLRLIAVESVGGKTRVAARGLPEGQGPLFGHLVMDDEEWASVVDAVTFLVAGCQCARCQADEGRE